MYWITKNLGTAPLREFEKIKKLKNVEIEIVRDLIDGKQINKGQFQSKVRHVENIIKKKKKAVIICIGGMSRSNAVALVYLIKNGMNFDEAYNLIKEKVLIVRIRPDLMKFIKKEYLN
ncbi:MAG: dual specificity protein phosphatase family protein [Candidatus Nanoarchaeia archaeon]